MKFYIASGNENARLVSQLSRALTAAGHRQTYDWTQHCASECPSIKSVRAVAERELSGVMEAELVIVVLPGGEGTHIELGAALGTGKPVLLFAREVGELVRDGRTCSHYWHPGITRIVGDMRKWIHAAHAYGMMDAGLRRAIS